MFIFVFTSNEIKDSVQPEVQYLVWAPVWIRQVLALATSTAKPVAHFQK